MEAQKHGAEYRRQWRKLHIGIDAQTMEIRAIEVTPNSVGDAPVLPSLLGQIDPHEALLSVSGDGAYDTKAWCASAVLRPLWPLSLRPKARAGYVLVSHRRSR